LSYLSVETDGGGAVLASADFSETSFMFEIGCELAITESFRVTPSLSWTSYGGEVHDDCQILKIPLSFSVSDKIDFSLAYEHASFSNSFSGASVEPETDAFLLGFDMKF
jgi:hypothetical protein